MHSFLSCADVRVHTLACQRVSNGYALLHRHSLNNSLGRLHTQAVSPRKGESESEFGLRCWQAGQSGRLVSDWNRVKVDVMCVAALQAPHSASHDFAFHAS